MAGRRVFFSFHYKEDVWRASNARNAGQFEAQAAAGWADASLWEKTKQRGPAAIRSLIDAGLDGTSVTAVLIGAHTAEREWVTYEIEQSIERGNGLLGVRIHKMEDQHGRRSTRGPVPKALDEGDYRVYTWEASSFGKWVELAAIGAGRKCLRHHEKKCARCKLLIQSKLLLRYW